jgi:hypothetical protein
VAVFSLNAYCLQGTFYTMMTTLSANRSVAPSSPYFGMTIRASGPQHELMESLSTINNVIKPFEGHYVDEAVIGLPRQMLAQIARPGLSPEVKADLSQRRVLTLNLTDRSMEEPVVSLINNWKTTSGWLDKTLITHEPTEATAQKRLPPRFVELDKFMVTGPFEPLSALFAKALKMLSPNLSADSGLMAAARLQPHAKDPAHYQLFIGGPLDKKTDKINAFAQQLQAATTDLAVIVTPYKPKGIKGGW